MSSLLAILLVVNSTRGHHYVFSYPEDPKRPLSSRDPNDTTSTATYVANPRYMPTDDSLNKHRKDPQEDSEDALFAGRDCILNMEVGFLADALAPKPPLCDRKFQLSIDDLTFVGHPVSLTPSHTHHPASTTTTTAAAAAAATNTSNTSNTTTTTTTTINTNTTNTNTTPPLFPLPPPPLPTTTTTTTTTCAAATKNNSLDEDKSHYPATHMTLFHVVFVLSPPDLELNGQVEAIYDHVVLRYTSALRYEQLRCGYVQQEIDKVLALKEDALNKGTPYAQVTQAILRVSSLTRDMRQIFLAISTNTTAHLIINDFIDLSLQIPLLGQVCPPNAEGAAWTREGHASWLMDIYGVGGYVYDTYPVLCPYHTLLLLEDPEEVLKNMPLDASPTLVHLVQILTPTQSLQELHLLLDCSLAQMYRLAAHLIYWRKAKLIHTIHVRNHYVVSPLAKLDDISALDQDFRLHIPNLDLPTLLSQLSVAKPLYKIAPTKGLRNQYLEAITYLVRKDLVVQLHMFLVLVLPFPPRQAQAQAQAQAQIQGSVPVPVQGHAPTQDSENEEEPRRGVDMAMSPGELEWKALKRLAHEKAPKEIADLFERLIPYMDGKHPIEEIMYREGVSRRQLSLVLKYYRDNIVTVHHY